MDLIRKFLVVMPPLKSFVKKYFVVSIEFLFFIFHYWFEKFTVIFLNKFNNLFKIKPLLYYQKRRTFLGGERIYPKGNVVFLIRIRKGMNLSRTLKSLIQQTNPSWLAYIFFENEEARRVKYNLNDQKVKFLDSVNVFWNELEFLDEKYLCFLDAGDEVDKKLVEILQYTDGDIVYFDQDLLSGDKYNYFLKPEWSFELWKSINLLHGAAFSIGLLRTLPVNKLNENILDFCAEALLRAKKILHIPTILLHCKKFPWEDDQLISEHKHQLEHYLSNFQFISKPVIQKRGNGSLKLKWGVVNEYISIIIPTRNHYQQINRCINSILDNSKKSLFELIIVDNDSTERDVLDFYNELKIADINFQIIKTEMPFNFSRACNQGAAKATGDLLLFLNNDTEIIDPDWLTNLAGVLQIPGVGVVGPKLLYPDGSVQHAGIVIGLEGHASHVFMGVKSDIYTPYGYVDWMRNVSAVTGACMMVRRDVFEKVGGFDESLTLAFGDVDLCLRIIDAGYRIVYTPDVQLIHYEGRTRGKYIPKQDFLAKREYFREKIKQGDPYYNPNLSRAWRIPTIRQPWEMDPVYRYDKIVEFKTR